MLDDPIVILRDYIPDALRLYADLIRGDNPRAFTRHRIVSTHDLLYQMLNRKGLTQWAEVEDFYHDMNTSISEKGFFLARQKFNPEAVHVMANEYIANIYDNYDDSIVKKHGLVILAVDGSKVTVPSTKKNIETFGQIKGETQNQPAMLLASTLHDSLNNLKLDVRIDRLDGSERALASAHVDHYCDNYTQKALFTFDRGYTSIKLIDQIINRGQYFLMRVNSKDFKKYFDQVEVGEDKILEVTYDTASSNQYRDDIPFRNHLLSTTYHLRFTKIVIGTDENGEDEVECLLSNIPIEEVPTEEFKELYWDRWPVETSYNRLKNRMKMEEFSGYNPVFIYQDIYADAWMYNLTSLKVIEVNEKVPIEQKEEGEYEIRRNFNKVIGTMKKNLLRAIMEEDPETREQLMRKIDMNIENALTWVKKEPRTFERKSPVNKSDMSYRKTY